jgi:hypothetical protein
MVTYLDSTFDLGVNFGLAALINVTISNPPTSTRCCTFFTVAHFSNIGYILKASRVYMKTARPLDQLYAFNPTQE